MRNLRENVGIYIVIVISMFLILGGVLNWNWIMEDPRARFVVDVFGRNGARIFFVGVGVVLIVGSLSIK